jgi:hypothetical protein
VPQLLHCLLLWSMRCIVCMWRLQLFVIDEADEVVGGKKSDLMTLKKCVPRIPLHLYTAAICVCTTWRLVMDGEGCNMRGYSHFVGHPQHPQHQGVLVCVCVCMCVFVCVCVCVTVCHVPDACTVVCN